MKYTAAWAALFSMLCIAAPASRGQSHARTPEAASTSAGGPQAAAVSAGKAFALSLLLPGLGQRYVHGGSWDGWASIFALTDVGLWTGLFGVEWRRDQLVDSYHALAEMHAGAETAGKDRTFFLNLAAYASSDEYTEAQLRARNWSRIDYASDPSFQWAWDSTERHDEFREARDQAESLRRRRTFIITTLVANRLIAGFTALRSARRAWPPAARLSLGVPPAGADAPLLRLDARF